MARLYADDQEDSWCLQKLVHFVLEGPASPKPLWGGLRTLAQDWVTGSLSGCPFDGLELHCFGTHEMTHKIVLQFLSSSLTLSTSTGARRSPETSCEQVLFMVLYGFPSFYTVLYGSSRLSSWPSIALHLHGSSPLFMASGCARAGMSTTQ